MRSLVSATFAAAAVVGCCALAPLAAGLVGSGVAFAVGGVGAAALVLVVAVLLLARARARARCRPEDG